MKSDEVLKLICKMEYHASTLPSGLGSYGEIKEVLLVAARVIEELTEDGWNNALKQSPKQNGQYLCIVAVPKCGGGYKTRQIVIQYTTIDGWNCDEMIILHWRELPPEPAGELAFIKKKEKPQ